MTDMIEIIEKKKAGGQLSPEDIKGFVSGVTGGSVPDYQAAALLMAICLKGMSREETYALTDAMLHSGEVMDLSGIEGTKVDKHSTGGVGDKISLVAAPIAASCGIKVAKMSGRGLGFTGGTVDKMESIPGFEVQLSPGEFFDAVNAAGMAIVGQTKDVAPADKKLYALRDVTATVDNTSLIASSIMSKKLASGSEAIVLDVKCGSGSFNKDLQAAKDLGRLMVDIGSNAGKKAVALVTDMNQPLGNAVGNSLEVIEAIETLKGRGPKDIEELSLSIAAYMVYCGGKAKTPEEGRAMAEEALISGKALETFRSFVKAQRGDQNIVDNYDLFKKPLYSAELRGNTFGYVHMISADTIGIVSQHLGAGRKTKEDTIDLSAGILLFKKLGDTINDGELMARLYSDDEAKLAEGLKKLKSAYEIAPDKPEIPVLIKEIIQ